MEWLKSESALRTLIGKFESGTLHEDEWRHYSRPLLNLVEARTPWVEPDLQSL